MPGNLEAPFGPNTRGLTAATYRVSDCWSGLLAGKPFVLALYASEYGGGGVAVRYGGQLVARILAGTGPPVVVRFTGDIVCWAEQAGAFYGAVDIVTGAGLSDQEAHQLCPAQPGAPPEVLGLIAQGTASTSVPSALPRSGDGGAANARP